MGKLPLRLRVLYNILDKNRFIHRYTIIRWLLGAGFTLAVALLPFTDTMRFDFWGGRHMVLGQQVDLVSAAKAFAFPFLGVNILIIVASRLWGRYLCGFVCPVGSLARLGEWLRFKRRAAGLALAGPLISLLVCLLLAVITFSFWVDWRVFWEGSAVAIATSALVIAALTLGLFGLAHGYGMGFCLNHCPSGVYFALLGQTSVNGVELAHPETCTDCGICDKVCPMELKPRSMLGELRGGRGLYGENISNFALCIRCGDCIVGCEEAGSSGEVAALAMGTLHGEPQAADSAQPDAPATPTPHERRRDVS
jgi:polyferredoxin